MEDNTISRRRRRHGARNQNRHKCFVKWLLDTFDNLKEADADENDNDNDIDIDIDIDNDQQEKNVKRSLQHVLDVAGGKGEVTARLTMCHRKRVIMIDPRPADIVHCFESLVLPKIPNKWQRSLEEKRSQNPAFVKETIQSRFRQIVTTFDERTLQSKEMQEIVQDSSLIIGLHADGATEAIVDAALQLHKAFVVVPCCVFPNLFSNRQIFDDATKKMIPVRSHQQFCDYLLAKDPRFRLEVLPFEGRNTAIWWDGK